MGTTPQNWAAILAGGDGIRLQGLTASLSGDRRPKQYCRLLGSETLLGETRQRVAAAVNPAHTVFVVTAPHEPYYRSELQGVDPWNIFAQPSNRGTLAAVAFTLARLRVAGATGMVGLFPCDHYYRDSELFCHVVSMAYWQGARRPDRVILVGADPTHPETDYGWIEPGVVIPHQQHAGGCRWTLRTVERFVEKPSPGEAKSLLNRGCVWNTLVVVGHIDAIEDLVVEARPEMAALIASLSDAMSRGSDTATMAELYRALPQADFSAAALANAAERLLVMTVPGLGWTDLGRPERVADVLADRHFVLTGTHMVG